MSFLVDSSRNGYATGRHQHRSLREALFKANPQFSGSLTMPLFTLKNNVHMLDRQRVPNESISGCSQNRMQNDFCGTVTGSPPRQGAVIQAGRACFSGREAEPETAMRRQWQTQEPLGCCALESKSAASLETEFWAHP